jgi:hypothetical protein
MHHAQFRQYFSPLFGRPLSGAAKPGRQVRSSLSLALVDNRRDRGRVFLSSSGHNGQMIIVSLSVFTSASVRREHDTHKRSGKFPTRGRGYAVATYTRSNMYTRRRYAGRTPLFRNMGVGMVRSLKERARTHTHTLHCNAVPVPRDSRPLGLSARGG